MIHQIIWTEYAFQLNLSWWFFKGVTIFIYIIQHNITDYFYMTMIKMIIIVGHLH